mgnify:CR=1 FL=1
MSKKDESGIPLSKIIISSAVGTVLFFLLLVSLAALVLKTSANQSLYLVYGLAAGVISGFANGFVASKLIKEKGLFYGAISGLIQSLVCALIVFILNKGTAGNGIFILIAIITLVSSLGGIAGMNLKKKIKY